MENENVNANENVTSKKGVKKVKKEDEIEQMKQMILNLAQTVGNLTEQLKQAQQSKPTPVIPDDAPIVEVPEEDLPEIHVEGLMMAKSKGTGEKYAKAGPYTYEIKGVPGDDDNFTLQAKKCMLLLFKAVEKSESKVISEATAMAVLRKHQRFISDRQDAWRVFAYYRAKLVQADFLVRRQKFSM